MSPSKVNKTEVDRRKHRITDAQAYLFLRERCAGKSITKAALIAFPDCKHEHYRKMKGIRLNKQLERSLGLKLKEQGFQEKIIHTLKSGLSALKLVDVTQGGERATEAFPDFSERRQTAELAAKMMGDLNTSTTVNIQTAEFTSYLIEQADIAKQTLIEAKPIDATYREITGEHSEVLSTKSIPQTTGDTKE